MTAHIISIGDELLIGQVINSNAAVIGQMLTGAGIHVERIIAIGDEIEAIKAGLDESWQVADIVIMTGGLGPTNDDRTCEALADYFGVPMAFSEETWERLKSILAQFNRTPTEAHRRQCLIPQNAVLLQNGAGTAPGMHFIHGDKQLFVMPGVPYEMDNIMQRHVLPMLAEQINGESFLITRTICTVGEGESKLAAMIQDIENKLPANVKLAYLPRPGLVRIRVLASGKDRALTEAALHEVAHAIEDRIDKYVYATEDISLAEAIGRTLKERNMMLAVAESCTGGYLGHLITSVAGSSAYFQGGVISYSNTVKEHVLGVNSATLLQHGAVSRETALAMAIGVRQKLHAEVALSVTGVAGPSGGSEEKPVGTVWIGIAANGFSDARQFKFTKDRARNIELSAINALNMLRKYLTPR